MKLRAPSARIWSAVNCHRFCRFGDLAPKQGPRTAARETWTPSRMRRRQVACRKRGQVRALQGGCGIGALYPSGASFRVVRALPFGRASPTFGLTRPGCGLMRNLQRKLSVARGEQPADLLFKNAQLVNVLSGEVHPAHVAVDDGRIIGFGEYEADRVIDLGGRFLAPSFIEGHFHVESAMLTIPELCRAVVPHGTGAMVIDPH